MQPVPFPEANEAIVVNGKEMPIYENGLQVYCCFRLNKEEIDQVFRTGKIWVIFPQQRPLPAFKLTVYNPLKKMEPLVVNERIVDRVVIHREDNDELILFRFKPGEAANIHDDFDGKVKVIGHGPERPEYRHIIDLYGFDVNWTYILKRIKND